MIFQYIVEINIFIDLPDKLNYPRSIFRVSGTSMKIFLSLLLWRASDAI